MRIPLTVRTIVFASIVSCGFAAPVQAQAAAVSESHNAAVLELMRAMRVEDGISTSMGIMMDAMIMSNPQLETLRPVFETFFNRYFTWAEMEDDFALLYATNFTESEIQDLLAFYRTPTGMKAAVTMPALMEESGLIGERQVEAHLPELEQMIMDYMARQTLPQVN
jgi:hypothetical protein